VNITDKQGINKQKLLKYSDRNGHILTQSSIIDGRCNTNGLTHMTSVVVVVVAVAVAVVVVGEVSLVCDQADMVFMLLRHVAEAITIPN